MTPIVLTGRIRSLRAGGQAGTWVALAPALLLVTVLFGGSLVAAGARSLGPAGPDDGGASLAAYRTLITSREFLPSLALTAHVAIISTVGSVVIGIALALALHRSARRRSVTITMLVANLPVPHVVGAVAMLLLLSQSGLISRAATQIGMIDEAARFPALLYDPLAIGVILHYLWKEVPFVTLVVYAILRSRGDQLDEVARTLGARRWQRFTSVTLPVVLPGALGAAAIVFAFTFGAFEVPLLLGRTFPAVLPVLAYRRYTDMDLTVRPEAMAATVVMTIVVIAVVAVAATVARRQFRSSKVRS